MKKNFYAALLAALILTSCVSSKNYLLLVNEKLQAGAEAQNTADRYNWLVLNTDSVGQNGNSVKQVEWSFVPAVVYWGWNSTIECEIDPNVTTAYLKKAIYKAADSLGLSEKLAGGNLIVNLNSLPGKFIYQNKGYTVFLLVAYSSSGIEAIFPRQTGMAASFEIQIGDVTIPGGDIMITNSGKPLNNLLRSTKKFTRFYLDQYHRETERMGLELVKEVVQKLDGGLIAGNSK